MHRSGPGRDPHVDHLEIVDRSDNGPVHAVAGEVGGALPVTRARSGAGVVVGSRLSRCSETHRGAGGLIVVGGAGVRRLDVGMEMIEDMFTMWGVPAPGLTAPLTAGVEIVAGILLVLGLGTRIAAMALSVVSIGALIYVKQDLGIISSQPMPGAELDLALLGGLIAVILLGPGPISLDHRLGIEPRETAARREPALV